MPLSSTFTMSGQTYTVCHRKMCTQTRAPPTSALVPSARLFVSVDMNGRVDGANANVGGAHWGLCPRAHFPVCI